MLYYIYILSGPLKGTIIPLPPNRYSLFLYNKECIENKKENDRTILYIPCDKQEDEKKLVIILDEDNSENNKYRIESSLIQKETDKEYPLKIDSPIYSNDTPIILISDKNDLSFVSFDFKKKKKTGIINKKIILLLILITLFFIALVFHIKGPTEEKIIPTVSKSLNFKGYQGKNGYYCVYDSLYPTSKIENTLENKIIYLEKIKSLSTGNNHQKIHIIFKDKFKPIVSFFYHNETEKFKIINNINSDFSKNCQPTIKGISIPNIINNINEFQLTKTIGYTIEEKNNGLTFIFNDELSVSNKEELDTYIKKQTAIFGRKFIFYRENISNPMLKNKATLQEDHGYIFLDNQHRYFPQG
ncbi:hypothetical protein ACBQ20_13405 [Proteus vulgaris]|uniref:hypothetical protein n=1 Tax=Proteus vulgaris TaxID=585 RepID=UPI0035256F4F